MRLATRLRPTAIRPTRIRFARAPGGSPPGPVTFPTTPLTFRVQIALGADLAASWLTWSWVDITEFVRYVDGITTRTGRPDESSVVTPGRTTLTLDNRDGRFCRRNPTGPYYGLLSKNTPLWIQVDAGSGFKTRVQHFINEWPTRWDKSGNDCAATIAASGTLRRLGQGQVQSSALRMATLAAAPDGYWPMEDGAQAQLVGSALPGVAALTIEGTIDFAATDGPPGSKPLCNGLTADLGTLVVPDVVPDGATAFQISFTFRAGQTAGSAGVIATWVDPTDATEQFWTITVDSLEGNQVSVFADNDGIGGLGSTIAASALDSVTFGEYYHGVYRQETDGTRSVYLNGVRYAGVVNGTSGPPRQMRVVPYRPDLILPQGEISVGHFGVWGDSTSDVPSLYNAMLGYAGEMAHVRIERICSQVGIAYASTGAVARSQALGPQPVGTPLQVIRDAEVTDMGVVFEAEFGLGYQGKTQRYNAPVLLSLDFNQGQVAEPPEPADDDQRTRNHFTASRTDGSEATVEDAESSAAEGLYDDSDTFNVYTDDQLANLAGWRVHQGTIDEDRWPSIIMDFARNPSLIDTWTSLPCGARLNAMHPPAEVAPDAIDAFIEGHAERFDPYSWRAAVNTTPATVYEVYQVSGDNNRGRVDAAASSLTVAVDSASTSLSVASPGAIWVQGAVAFDIFVAGERMTVTNITGATSPQTFTVARSVNEVVKAQAAGAAVKLWRPGAVAL